MEFSPVAARVAIAHRARYERLWSRITAEERGLVADLLRTLEAEFSRSQPGTWSEADALATIGQLRAAIRGLTVAQSQRLTEALAGVAGRAQKDTAAWLRRLDKAFTGSVRPLRWDTLQWLRGYSSPLLDSRLRQYQRSFARYGADSVIAIEREVAKAALIGRPWTEARKKVWEITRDVVGDRQWMVDRIVRTETATVYNSTTIAALTEEDTDPDDPMLKKLVAIHDKVTGADSVALHGQTRRMSELFTDVVRGKSFEAPPNRPNDREIPVGWRTSWGSGAAFDRATSEATDSASSG